MEDEQEDGSGCVSGIMALTIAATFMLITLVVGVITVGVVISSLV